MGETDDFLYLSSLREGKTVPVPRKAVELAQIAENFEKQGMNFEAIQIYREILSLTPGNKLLVARIQHTIDLLSRGVRMGFSGSEGDGPQSFQPSTLLPKDPTFEGSNAAMMDDLE
jgi:hypothetical protein